MPMADGGLIRYYIQDNGLKSSNKGQKKKAIMLKFKTLASRWGRYVEAAERSSLHSESDAVYLSLFYSEYRLGLNFKFRPPGSKNSPFKWILLWWLQTLLMKVDKLFKCSIWNVINIFQVFHESYFLVVSLLSPSITNVTSLHYSQPGIEHWITCF